MFPISGKEASEQILFVSHKGTNIGTGHKYPNIKFNNVFWRHDCLGELNFSVWQE